MELYIDDLQAAAYRIATDTPEADGTLTWGATEMVVVSVRSGNTTGTGYSYTAGRAAQALVMDQLKPAILGQDALDLPALWFRLNRSLRNVGRPGLGLMALAAVETALWDLKARLLRVSLSDLLGKARPAVPVYGSGGFITYSDAQLQGQLEEWLELGLTSVKIKLGLGVDEDARRVALARSVIGPEVELMVDVNGAYSLEQATALLEATLDYDIHWLEEPVPSDDLDGLRRLRDRAPGGLAIAAGEYGWDANYFHRMLNAGAVDVLQADATRCGYTGFMQAAHLCESLQRPLSAHCAPALHVPVCAAAPRLQHLEYFHDHVRIEQAFFDGMPELRDGMLWPDRDAPGHGLQLRAREVESYRI